MDITRIVRVRYANYPNSTCIIYIKNKKKNLNLSQCHSHSLCLFSAFTITLSLRALQYPPLLTVTLSLSLSLSFSSLRFYSIGFMLWISRFDALGRFCLSHICTFIGFGIDFLLDSRSSFFANQLGLPTTLFPQVND